MALHFDSNNISSVAFGVHIPDSNGIPWILIPTDSTIKDIIREMISNTIEQLGGVEQANNLPYYEPAEKYGTIECLKLGINDDISHLLPVALFNARNLPIAQQGLENPSDVVFYFVICSDSRRRKILGVRRATQFKAMLKARYRVVRWVDDTLKSIEDNVFKLDQDFDYVVTLDTIYILRPSGFEFTADIDEQVLLKAESNTQQLQQEIGFIDFEPLSKFVSTRKRAARLVASIRSRADLNKINKGMLKAMCSKTGVGITERSGKIYPKEGEELAFLMLLDRRRFNFSIIEGTDEYYEASSRKKVDK
ncbi:MAG: DUF4868 domain-containing protein [Candidatus Lokiarchaeota archaeon]|nr:DUF4868 domain-containing protein [Candidatus Lokiarchaeota archaeon]